MKGSGLGWGVPRHVQRLTGSFASLWSRLSREEIVVLLALCAVAGTLALFVRLADEVIEGDTRAFDEAILLALRNPGDLAQPVGPGWLLQVARDITSLGGFTVLTLVTAAVVGFLAMARARAAALLVFVSVVGGTLLSTALKLLFERARPDVVPHVVEVHTLSFPSGHAMMSAVVYLTLGALLARIHRRRRLKAYVIGVALVLTVIVGLSRVYLGVHWPTDVLAGWCVGAGWATLCWSVMLWLQRAGKVEQQAETPAG